MQALVFFTFYFLAVLLINVCFALLLFVLVPMLLVHYFFNTRRMHQKLFELTIN